MRIFEADVGDDLARRGQDLPAVQLGGEAVGHGHTAYLRLAKELGLALIPSCVQEPGRMTRATPEGLSAGEPPHWFGPGDAALHSRLSKEFSALAATVDPDDPWSHPDAAALDRLSVADWLRSGAAGPAVVRLWDIGQLALAGGSYVRISLLAALRSCPSGRCGTSPSAG